MDPENNINGAHDAALKGDINIFFQHYEKNPSFPTNQEGQTPLHIIIKKEHYHWLDNEKFTKLLTTEIVNLQDKNGNTALQQLLLNFDFTEPEVKALNILSSFDVNLNLKNQKHRSSLTNYYDRMISFDGQVTAEKMEVAKKILSDKFIFTLEKLEQFRSLHQLYVIFGGPKLSDKLGFLDEFFYSGRSTEGVQLLTKKFKKYITTFQPKEPGFNQILALWEKHFVSCVSIYNETNKIIDEINSKKNPEEKSHVTTEQYTQIKSEVILGLANKIVAGSPCLLDSGNSEHVISVMLEKMGEEIVLTMAERGLWVQSSPLPKKSGIRTLRFPASAEITKKIIECLFKAKISEEKEAAKILFEEIPSLSGSNYLFQNSQGTDVQSEPFKIGICYFANHKLMLHDLFYKYLAFPKIQYKLFDIFLHQDALDVYQEKTPIGEQNLALIELCKNIISEKQRHLELYQALLFKQKDEIFNLLSQENTASNSELHTLYNMILSNPDDQIISSLLECGYNINHKNKESDTLLHIAAKHGDVKTIIQLIKLGASPLLTDAQGLSFLHLLIKNKHYECFNNEEFLKLLTPQLINQQDENGDTIMHYLCDNFLYPNKEEVNVAEKLLKIGGSLTIKNKRNLTPTLTIYDRMASLNGKLKLDKIETLNQYISDPRLKIDLNGLQKFALHHALYVIFGGKKLSDKLGMIDGFFTAGRYYESLDLLKATLLKFVTEYYPLDKSLNNLVKEFSENFSFFYEINPNIKTFTKDILSGKKILTDSGSVNHIVGVSLERMGDEVVLSLYERGIWAQKSSSSKVKGVQSIRIKADEESVETVLTLLCKARQSNQNDGYQILFNDIPKKIGGDYYSLNIKNQEVLTSPNKASILFFLTLKLMLHDLFLKANDNGAIFYKEFDLFMKSEILTNYLQSVPQAEQDQQLIDLCSLISDEKLKKLNQMTETKAAPNFSYVNKHLNFFKPLPNSCASEVINHVTNDQLNAVRVFVN